MDDFVFIDVDAFTILIDKELNKWGTFAENIENQEIDYRPTKMNSIMINLHSIAHNWPKVMLRKYCETIDY